MPTIQCPTCQQQLSISPEHAGKTVACPCGTQLRVPGGPSPTPSPQQPAASSIVVQCPACGKKLKAPANARGSIIRCPCGNQIQLAGGPQTPPAPTIASNSFAPGPAPANNNDDMWDDLPDPNAQQPGFGQPGYGQAGFPGAPEFGNQQDPAAPQPMSTAQKQLHDARAELQREGSMPSSGGGGGFMNGATMGGLVMMGISVVWFFGGLAAGIIFFYPPVMFILGLGSFIKGCLGNDD